MIEYTVHSCHETELPVEAEVRGRKARAYLPSLVVELVQNDDEAVGEPHGHTFRLCPKNEREMERMRGLFEVGARIKATFSVIHEKVDRSEGARE